MRQLDAAIDGPVAQPVAIAFCQYHGARAAVPFAATFFGAGAMQVFAQHLQQRAAGGHLVQLDHLAAADKTDRLCVHGFVVRG